MTQQKLTPAILVIPHLFILRSASSLKSSSQVDWEMFICLAHLRNIILGWMHTRQLWNRTKMKYRQAKARQNSKIISHEIILSSVLNSVRWSGYTALSSCYFIRPDIILKTELFLIIPFSLNNCNYREDMNMLVVCSEIWGLRWIMYSQWRTLQLIYSKCNLSL